MPSSGNHAMDDCIRVAIIHRHQVFRESLAYALSQDSTISLSCQFAELQQVPRNWEGPCPDIALIEMVDASRPFLERVGNLKSVCPGCRIIMLDVPECDDTVLACVEVTGATGYVNKNGSLDDVFHTIRSVMSGETPCPPRVVNLVFSRVSELSRQITMGQSHSSSGLTRREQDIVRAIEQGLSNKEIAAQLGIEVSTVKNHVHNILDKLQLNDRQSAVRYLKEHGLNASMHASTVHLLNK